MKKIAIVGVEGSGKTVLMAAMGEKYRKPGEDGLFLYANSRETVEYCNEQINMLRNQHKWPDSTPPDSLINLEWTLMRRKKGGRPEELCSVAFLDFAGEIYRYAFAESEDDEDKRNSYKKQIEAVKSHLKSAESVIVLINLSDIINSKGVSQEASEMDWLSQRIFDFAINETNAQHFAIAFTQKDLYEESIAMCGGIDEAFREYLPAVFFKYETVVTPFAIAAVNKTIPDDVGNLIPDSEFESEGLEGLVSWMANIDESLQHRPRSAQWYYKAADGGDAIAQNNLGVAYENGHGVERDYAEAVKWYLEAAKQGNATAQCNLGLAYDHGRGVECNHSEAVKWYRKAAEQGNAIAQCNLGVAYENGTGVERNIEAALKWYKRSAENGDEDGQKRAAELTRRTSILAFLKPFAFLLKSFAFLKPFAFIIFCIIGLGIGYGIYVIGEFILSSSVQKIFRNL